MWRVLPISTALAAVLKRGNAKRRNGSAVEYVHIVPSSHNFAIDARAGDFRYVVISRGDSLQRRSLEWLI
jgi:hypothetical protein